MTPYVYSGDHGRIYRYEWSKSKKSLPALTAALDARRGALQGGFQCGGDAVRV
jgi:hypothetical protein